MLIKKSHQNNIKSNKNYKANSLIDTGFVSRSECVGKQNVALFLFLESETLDVYQKTLILVKLFQKVQKCYVWTDLSADVDL